MRLFFCFLLLALAAFCLFGFAATYEPVDNALAWRVGYGLAIVACLYGILWLRRRRPGRG